MRPYESHNAVKPVAKLPKSLRKEDIAKFFQLSPSALRVYLNDVYYNELKEAGYNKRSKQLTWKQFKIFVNEYGTPFNCILLAIILMPFAC